MTIIHRKNGEIINFKDTGIKTKDIIISSPEPIHNFENIEGVDGVIDYGTTYGPREIVGRFRIQPEDYLDYALYRDQIFNLFRSKESFYLIDIRQKGKRWLVKVNNPYTIPRRGVFGDFDIDFIGLKGYAESIGTTQDIQRNGISADDELWGYGMGLLAEDDSLVYTHQITNGIQFAVYNAGNVAIHPFQQELKITIKNIVNGYGLQLKNDTNGTTFKVNDAVLKQADVIMLDGPNITSNGISFLRYTNKQYIQMSPGWNYFTLTGATSATVEFDFRFYYS